MPGLLRGIARTAAIAGTATVVSNRVSRRQGRRWAAKDQQEAEAQQDEQQQYEPEPEQEPAGDTMEAKLAQLKQLGELKDSGVLTGAEFQAQKARILGL